jgi:hypothetical protein
MRSNQLRRILTTLILIAAVAVPTVRVFPPSALPVDAPAGKFSAERAIETIKAIAQSPRLIGSLAYENARAYLLEQLTALGLTTEIQNTTLDGVEVENILGRLDGTSSSNAILLSAHLDSVSSSPGATDDASGVATVLETVRTLRAGAPLDNTIIVLFTGPEENCCYGAKAFATQHPWAGDVRLVVNVDAGGLSGPSILAATGPEAGWLVREMAGVLPDPVGSSAIEALGSPATDYTLELRKAGFIGFDFNLSWDKRIHSSLDNVDNINPASLQHQGEHMLAVARRFGNLSLDFAKEPRPIYFDLLGLTILYYPTSWAIYILIGITLVFAGVLFLGFRQKHITLKGMAIGVSSLLLSLLTVPLLLALIQLAIYHPSPAATPVLTQATPVAGTQRVIISQPPSKLEAELSGESWLSETIRWGSAALALITTPLWYALFHKIKKVGRDDFVMGAYLLLYIAAFGTSIFVPALSYIFSWPLLFGLVAAVFLFRSKVKNAPESGWPQLLGVLGSAVIAIVLFVPGILIALLSIDIRMIYYVPVFVVALLGFLVAPLEILFSRLYR